MLRCTDTNHKQDQLNYCEAGFQSLTVCVLVYSSVAHYVWLNDEKMQSHRNVPHSWFSPKHRCFLFLILVHILGNYTDIFWCSTSFTADLTPDCFPVFLLFFKGRTRTCCPQLTVGTCCWTRWGGRVRTTRHWVTSTSTTSSWGSCRSVRTPHGSSRRWGWAHTATCDCRTRLTTFWSQHCVTRTDVNVLMRILSIGYNGWLTFIQPII